MAWRRRRSAYYGGNYGNEYSRSARAQEAEDAGRYPRTRAASALGVSVKAFDAGCAEAGYRSTEWHHIGKYANMVDYYDTNTLADDPKFWRGCASAYKSKAKQSELNQKAEQCEQNEPSQSGSSTLANSPPNSFNASGASSEIHSSGSCVIVSAEAAPTSSRSDLATA